MSFNAQTIHLQGRHLIEASAGTGKTYSIANLFLRLLLDPHPANAQQPLAVDQILVVTFTNAAADELRARIRAKVEAALQYMQTANTEDMFIQTYLSALADDKKLLVCQRLYQALLCIDEAAIFTIHSFAVRAVKMFMFETGAYADIQVAIGGDTDKERLIKNLWRELQWLDIADKSAVFNDFSTFSRFFSQPYQAELRPQLTANSMADLLNDNHQQQEMLEWPNYVKAFLFTLLNKRLAHHEKAVLQPDDVIALINAKLMQKPGGTLLRQALQKQFPVCLVDECQDTDPEQFRLFNAIYTGQGQEGLYIIGDPKQSIYAFRGADIFSYLAVKQALTAEHIHTLDTNFRSTAGIMKGVNALFQEQEAKPSFMYQSMDYEPIHSCENPTSGKPQQKGKLYIGNEAAKPFVFVSSANYETFNNMLSEFANDTAERIVQLLNQQAYVEKNAIKTPLCAADITVLVRDKSEASAIKKALAARQLLSVYLSQKESVFDQCEFAQDILFILKAIAEPTDKPALKAAYATLFMRGFSESFTVLEQLEQDDHCLEQLITQFSRYQHQVHYKGILSVLNQLFNHANLAAAFAQHKNSDRLMTDFRHLGELLQKEFNKTGSLERLIEWYQQQLNDDSDVDGEEKSQRLESDAELIQIVTLHGCKGLEYKVVFIPFFFSGVKKPKNKVPPFFHQQAKDSQLFKAVLDFTLPDAEAEAQMAYEAQAENLRLLYVGITRAIYQCYIGVASARYGNSKASNFSKTPWGHLLSIPAEQQTLEKSLFDEIGAALAIKMQGVDYHYELSQSTLTQFTASITSAESVLVSALPLSHLPQSSWLISSYSSLSAQKEHVLIKTSADDEVLENDTPLLNTVEQDNLWESDIRFTLERSNRTGDCLHGIFEDIAKSYGEYNTALLEHHLRLNGLLANLTEETIQQTVIQLAVYIEQLLQQPLLASEGIPNLATIFKQGTLPELVFDFGVASTNNGVSIESLNKVLGQVCNASGSLARRDAKPLLQGIMNGSIDLLFVHNKKVYVLDYKSNTLGLSPEFYDKTAMHSSILASQYDVQYFIYSVAAHRYMQQRLASRYQFDGGEYQFGGVFYLYLRGMACEGYKEQGIYYTRPQFEQVKALDLAFSGLHTQVAV